jgi:hypothetical protein
VNRIVDGAKVVVRDHAEEHFVHVGKIITATAFASNISRSF